MTARTAIHGLGADATMSARAAARRCRRACLAALLAIAGCDVSDRGGTDPEALVAALRVSTNGDVTAGLPVRYQPFEAPQLSQLRQQEELEAVVAGARDEFERALLLKEWVASQWPHGVPDPYPPWDALVILDWIRSGRTGGFCGQYSQVLLQALASLGLTARYVELGNVENPYAHFVTEVWSNQFNKWVVLDADYNVHFERDGIPLGALEVHDALIGSRLSEIVVVPGAFRDGHPDPFSWPDGTAELYYYVRLHLKADHLSMPDEPPFDRFNDMVDWSDGTTVMWEASTVESVFPKERLTNLQSGDRVAFVPTLNNVHVTINAVLPGRALLFLENNVFQFDRYLLRESGPHGPLTDWREARSAFLVWRPSGVGHKLEIRGANLRGVEGPAAVVEN